MSDDTIINADGTVNESHAQWDAQDQRHLNEAAWLRVLARHEDGRAWEDARIAGHDWVAPDTIPFAPVELPRLVRWWRRVAAFFVW